MEVYKLKQERKRHAVLVALATHHSDFENATFLKGAKSSIYKVRTEVVCCGGDVVGVVKKQKAQSGQTLSESLHFSGGGAIHPLQ